MSTGLRNFSRATGMQTYDLPTKDARQQQLSSDVYGAISPHVGQSFSSLGKMASGDQSEFEAMEKPALRQFGQLQGNMASRFSGIGSGSRNSSGFQNTMSEAGAGLAEQLQSQRMGYQTQARQQMMSMISELLGQKNFESLMAPKQRPWWQEMMAGLVPAVGSGALGVGQLYGAKKLGVF